MIEATIFRIRIGIYNSSISRIVQSRGGIKSTNRKRFRNQKHLLIFFLISQVIALTILLSSLQVTPDPIPCKPANRRNITISTQPTHYLYRRGKHQSMNFKAKLLHGNIRKGIKNIHVNVRLLYNQMSEVKLLVQRQKPHILRISEAELRKGAHSLSDLKVPGYALLLPKSWDIHGKARVVVSIQKTLEYEQLPDLENDEV